MPSLSLSCDAESLLNVQCLGAHSDDIEIGCDGAILRLAQQEPNSLSQREVFSAIGLHVVVSIQWLQKGYILLAQPCCCSRKDLIPENFGLIEIMRGVAEKMANTLSRMFNVPGMILRDKSGV